MSMVWGHLGENSRTGRRTAVGGRPWGQRTLPRGSCQGPSGKPSNPSGGEGSLRSLDNVVIENSDLQFS